MKTYLCIGYPDEENIYHQNHTSIEEWRVQANSQEEAERKAWKHFYYFHEVAVYEDSDRTN